VRPEEVLDAAREAAARAGHDLDRLEGMTVRPTDRVGLDQLFEWAVIEPDPALLRSTRRFGAPVTWLKRLARRALQQELNELTSQQTRFNLHVLERLVELEERRDDGRPPGPQRRGPG
jgi:hypothetical protein